MLSYWNNLSGTSSDLLSLFTFAAICSNVYVLHLFTHATAMPEQMVQGTVLQGAVTLFNGCWCQPLWNSTEAEENGANQITRKSTGKPTIKHTVRGVLWLVRSLHVKESFHRWALPFRCSSLHCCCFHSQHSRPIYPEMLQGPEMGNCLYNIYNPIFSWAGGFEAPSWDVKWCYINRFQYQSTITLMISHYANIKRHTASP